MRRLSVFLGFAALFSSALFTRCECGRWIDKINVDEVMDTMGTNTQQTACLLSADLPWAYNDVLQDSLDLFKASALTPIPRPSQLRTDFDQSFALGFFSTQMLYCELFGQDARARQHLALLDALAEATGALPHGPAMDSALSDTRFRRSLRFFTQGLNRDYASRYRNSLDLVAIAGAFVAEMHLVGQTPMDSLYLYDLVGARKSFASMLNATLGFYFRQSQDPQMKTLLENMDRFKEAFARIGSVQTQHEAVLVEIDGRLERQRMRSYSSPVGAEDLEAVTGQAKLLRDHFILRKPL